MADPITIDIRHALGRDEAKRRISANVGRLGAQMPGGLAQVSSSWQSPDRMALTITMLGQSLPATLDLREDVVSISLVLPAMLSFMAGTIETMVRRQGSEILLGDGAHS